MSDETPMAPMGHNSGAMALEIAQVYSPLRLADEFGDLALEVQGLNEHAGRFTEVCDPETSAQAAALVVSLRALVKKVDDKSSEVGKPLYDAHKTVTAFFNGLNNSDTKKPGPLTKHKLRLENLIRDHAFRVAEEERRKAAIAAAEQRARQEAEAKAAAEAEAANKTAVAEVLMDEAVKTEKLAAKIEARADGPVQDLARQRTEEGVVGLQGRNTFRITDEAALRATFGHLGPHMPFDGIERALRDFLNAQKDAGKLRMADAIFEARKAITTDPSIPGVDFFVQYSGSVRA